GRGFFQLGHSYPCLLDATAAQRRCSTPPMFRRPNGGMHMSVSKTGLIAALIVLAGCPFESVDSSVSSKSRSSSAHGRGHGRGHGRTAMPVVFDTDMDFDDAAALAYLCQEHKLGQIDLRAVTVSNNGVGLPGSAIRHARCVLAEC